MKDGAPFLERHLPDLVLLVYLLAATIGAFAGGLWAALGIGGGLMLFFAAWRLGRVPPLPEKNLAAAALAFLAAAACLNFDSSQPGMSWHEEARLATIFVPLLFLLSPAAAKYARHPAFFAIIPAAMALAGLALAAMLYAKTPAIPDMQISLKLTKYNRGFSYLMLLSFPMMAALWHTKGRWTAMAFVLLLLIPANYTESRTAKLALILALAATALAALLPVMTRRLFALAPFAALGWPFAARWVFIHHYDWLAHIPDSWRARIEIWDYMSYRIAERPWLGWGLGTSATLDYANPHGALYVFTKMPAAHPHNVMTQLWVELGLPGLALGVVFALLALHKASRLDARLAPFALGAWAAAFCLCLLAYDFWTDSLFAAFALTGLAFMLLEQKLKVLRSSPGVPRVH